MIKLLLRCLTLLVSTGLLAGCSQFTVLFPSGYVAAHQRDILIASVVLMALIVIPLFVAIVWIGVRYRESNRKSAYAPEWETSTRLELLMWAAPLAIVITLGAIAWVGTHTLDPYTELTHINNNQPVPEHVQPVNIDVVALNWKWLFLYPDYGIATINTVAAPVDVPIHFRITATDLMNSFYIPALAGQIYAMPGMQTQLNAVINKPGKYKGVDANYSGKGFNHMGFQFLGMEKGQFKQWVAGIKNGGGDLTHQRFRKLAKPSIHVQVKHYGDYADKLFGAIVQRCFAGAASCKLAPDGVSPVTSNASSHNKTDLTVAAAGG